MNKYIYIIGMVLLSLPGLLAAQTSQELVDAFSKKYKNAPALQTSFTVDGRVKGSMILQGDCFYIEMDEYRIYCDGKVRWFYNEGIEEVTQSAHDPKSGDIIKNPAAFFRHLHTGYYITATPAAGEGIHGEAILNVTLLPNESKSPFEKVILGLRAADTVPVRIAYTLKEGGSSVITLDGFEIQDPFPASRFEFVK